MDIQYPTRCRIIDVTGVKQRFGKKEYTLNTPDKSKPHIDKEGLAEKVDSLNVKITLDDGTVLMGYECWWIPISPK